MRHHTKDKGDAGVGHVIADCLRNGVQVGLLLSEHLPFDLIAISEDNRLARLSVKYRAVGDGAIYCDLRSSWADQNGFHVKPFDPGSCDAVAVVCPEPFMCCYVRTEEIKGHSVKLRIRPPLNNQLRGIRMANDYTDPRRIFQRP